MNITEATSLVELAACISQALERAGITAVLSGGGAVSIHTDNKYQSKDLDFVTSAGIGQLVEILAPLGFTREGNRRYLVHPRTQWSVEFPSGPVTVGNAVISDWIQLDTEFGMVHVLSPTQSVMDRLAAYFHWNDPQAAEQARLIVRDRDVDWGALDVWAAGEDQPEKYQAFKDSLAQADD